MPLQPDYHAASQADRPALFSQHCASMGQNSLCESLANRNGALVTITYRTR